MKSMLSKFIFILFAGVFVFGLAACKQAEEPAEVEEVEEVEVEVAPADEAAPADTDMTDSMAEPTVQSTVGTEVEVDEVEVDETVESVEDAAPDSATDDAEKKAQ